MREDFRLFLEYFTIAWIMSCLAITARIANMLARDPVPPLEPEKVILWRAQRRWVWIAELAAAPVLAAVTATATFFYEGNPWVAAAGGIVTGALGFPFLVRALKTMIDRRYDIKEG